MRYTDGMRPFFTSRRILELFSFLVLSVAFVLSLLLEADPHTWVPAARVVVPVVNGLCAAACLVLICRPGIQQLEIGILLLQSMFTAWTGYEILGTFLYSALIVLLFCHGYFKEHLHRRITLLVAVWLVGLLGVIPYGAARCILAYTTFSFMIAFYYAVYTELKGLLSPLLPVQAAGASVKLPAPGGKIHLQDCGLTERQCQLLREFLANGATYAELAARYYISVSTVKKDMAQVLRLFGVKNNDDLRLLLSQYTVE